MGGATSDMIQWTMRLVNKTTPYSHIARHTDACEMSLEITCTRATGGGISRRPLGWEDIPPPATECSSATVSSHTLEYFLHLYHTGVIPVKSWSARHYLNLLRSFVESHKRGIIHVTTETESNTRPNYTHTILSSVFSMSGNDGFFSLHSVLAQVWFLWPLLFSLHIQTNSAILRRIKIRSSFYPQHVRFIFDEYMQK